MSQSFLNYSIPQVTLLHHSGIGSAEIAARTCYDSFEASENQAIVDAKSTIDTDAIYNIEESQLLSQLAWVHHHHSILEHSFLTYLIKGTSRGVLQEHARHRIQSLSVRSTRYTMSGVINAFVASSLAKEPLKFFITKLLDMDLFVINNEAYLEIEIQSIYQKLKLQEAHEEDFLSLCIAKSSMDFLENITDPDELFTKLQQAKKKRNVGDSFKHIVTDNWKVDMVVTFNLRSLKNYFDLRDSGAAWFQIRTLAKEMKRATPLKYLKLIDKTYKENA